jgi:hypothetical protein
MPILFTFDQRQVLLWLVEFQEDKKRFSIYKLLRYVTDLLEQYPEALLIPADWIGGLSGRWKQTPFRRFWRNNRKQRHAKSPLIPFSKWGNQS